MKIAMPEKKVRKRILIVVIVLGIVIFLFGNRHFRTLMTLYKERKRLSEYLNVVEDNNKKLKEKLKMIKNDPDYLEDLARKKLGMIKHGEIKYKFIDIEEFKTGKKKPKKK